MCDVFSCSWTSQMLQKYVTCSVCVSVYLDSALVCKHPIGFPTDSTATAGYTRPPRAASLTFSYATNESTARDFQRT
jgi:hypothetical protein